MSVSAIIVTRGDVDLGNLVASFPEEWEVLIWDNGGGTYREGGIYKRVTSGGLLARRVTGIQPWPDLAVYGRYAAIEYTDAELIYVQDDDCVVSDPQAIAFRWREESIRLMSAYRYDDPVAKGQRHVVCNMPPEFRHEFYEEHALVGFGACFHRDAPQRAFGKFNLAFDNEFFAEDGSADYDMYRRTCDVVFTALTPRVLVDAPYENLPWATDESRMYRQPEHIAERMRMLELVRQVGDA